MTDRFWEWEEAQRRMADYRARFLSWRKGRRIVAPNPTSDPHWLHLPMRYADTGEPVTEPRHD